jgi:hypothetical protein
MIVSRLAAHEGLGWLLIRVALANPFTSTRGWSG